MRHQEVVAEAEDTREQEAEEGAEEAAPGEEEEAMRHRVQAQTLEWRVQLDRRDRLDNLERLEIPEGLDSPGRLDLMRDQVLHAQEVEPAHPVPEDLQARPDHLVVGDRLDQTEAPEILETVEAEDSPARLDHLVMLDRLDRPVAMDRQDHRAIPEAVVVLGVVVLGVVVLPVSAVEEQLAVVMVDHAIVANIAEA